MTTSGRMVKTIAAATGISEPTIAIIVRKLREANLIPKAGRGLHAARMTPRDAARVLIALLTSERPVDAPDKVQNFGQLHCSAPKDNAAPTQFNVDFSDTRIFENDLAAVIQALADDPERRSWTTMRQVKKLISESDYFDRVDIR